MENQNNSHQNNLHQNNPYQNNSHQNSPRKQNLAVLIVCALLTVVAIIIMWIAIADVAVWPKCVVPKEEWNQDSYFIYDSQIITGSEAIKLAYHATDDHVPMIINDISISSRDDVKALQNKTSENYLDPSTKLSVTVRRSNGKATNIVLELFIR